MTFKLAFPKLPANQCQHERFSHKKAPAYAEPGLLNHINKVLLKTRILNRDKVALPGSAARQGPADRGNARWYC
jgi:hypothetical protein